jgi:Cu(I)/Ag(I) efflux system membrane fusion protein
MKKGILLVLILAVAGVAAYFLFFKKEEKREEGEKQKPLAVGEHNNVFSQSYNKLLTAYTGVKDALVASDTAKASAAAMQLKVAADSLKVNEIQGDSTGVLKETAMSYASTISSSSHALALEANIAEKRKEFEMIAEALWNLTRTVKYSSQKLYWQYCPMAFNNRGANWVSTEAEIRNPYFGKEMLECGSTQDSLDFSAKK